MFSLVLRGLWAIIYIVHDANNKLSLFMGMTFYLWVKINWAVVRLTTTQPGIIATIYLSPIALLKNKTPYFLTIMRLALLKMERKFAIIVVISIYIRGKSALCHFRQQGFRIAL